MDRETVIHLTGRPAVAINEAEWPVIARAFWPTDRGTAKERAYVRVRRHPDGRTIVYGLRADGKREQKVGFLLDAENATVPHVADAVKKTCALVGIEPQEVFDDLPPEAL